RTISTCLARARRGDGSAVAACACVPIQAAPVARPKARKLRRCSLGKRLGIDQVGTSGGGTHQRLCILAADETIANRRNEQRCMAPGATTRHYLASLVGWQGERIITTFTQR